MLCALKVRSCSARVSDTSRVPPVPPGRAFSLSPTASRHLEPWPSQSPWPGSRPSRRSLELSRSPSQVSAPPSLCAAVDPSPPRFLFGRGGEILCTPSWGVSSNLNLGSSPPRAPFAPASACAPPHVTHPRPALLPFLLPPALPPSSSHPASSSLPPHSPVPFFIVTHHPPLPPSSSLPSQPPGRTLVRVVVRGRRRLARASLNHSAAQPPPFLSLKLPETTRRIPQKGSRSRKKSGRV